MGEEEDVIPPPPSPPPSPPPHPHDGGEMRSRSERVSFDEDGRASFFGGDVDFSGIVSDSDRSSQLFAAKLGAVKSHGFMGMLRGMKQGGGVKPPSPTPPPPLIEGGEEELAPLPPPPLEEEEEEEDIPPPPIPLPSLHTAANAEEGRGEALPHSSPSKRGEASPPPLPPPLLGLGGEGEGRGDEVGRSPSPPILPPSPTRSEEEENEGAPLPPPPSFPVDDEEEKEGESTPLPPPPSLPVDEEEEGEFPPPPPPGVVPPPAEVGEAEEEEEIAPPPLTDGDEEEEVLPPPPLPASPLLPPLPEEGTKVEGEEEEEEELPPPTLVDEEEEEGDKGEGEEEGEELPPLPPIDEEEEEKEERVVGEEEEGKKAGRSSVDVSRRSEEETPIPLPPSSPEGEAPEGDDAHLRSEGKDKSGKEKEAEKGGEAGREGEVDSDNDEVPPLPPPPPKRERIEVVKPAAKSEDLFRAVHESDGSHRSHSPSTSSRSTSEREKGEGGGGGSSPLYLGKGGRRGGEGGSSPLQLGKGGVAVGGKGSSRRGSLPHNTSYSRSRRASLSVLRASAEIGEGEEEDDGMQARQDFFRRRSMAKPGLSRGLDGGGRGGDGRSGRVEVEDSDSESESDGDANVEGGGGDGMGSDCGTTGDGEGTVSGGGGRGGGGGSMEEGKEKGGEKGKIQRSKTYSGRSAKEKKTSLTQFEMEEMAEKAGVKLRFGRRISSMLKPFHLNHEGEKRQSEGNNGRDERGSEAGVVRTRRGRVRGYSIYGPPPELPPPLPPPPTAGEGGEKESGGSSRSSEQERGGESEKESGERRSGREAGQTLHLASVNENGSGGGSGQSSVNEDSVLVGPVPKFKSKTGGVFDPSVLGKGSMPIPSTVMGVDAMSAKRRALVEAGKAGGALNQMYRHPDDVLARLKEGKLEATITRPKPYAVMPDSMGRARSLSIAARAHNVTVEAMKETGIDCQVQTEGFLFISLDVTQKATRRFCRLWGDGQLTVMDGKKPPFLRVLNSFSVADYSVLVDDDGFRLEDAGSQKIIAFITPSPSDQARWARSLLAWQESIYQYYKKGLVPEVEAAVKRMGLVKHDASVTDVIV
mmetsp:Transcript_47594/g.123328  ORF Transcript_47594/g.123328 Transcript_47594/m.123328 type:complete len:1089 (-) Transcript_47594:163-3429(-)